MGVSLWEAITLLPALTWVLGKGILALVFGPLRSGHQRTKPYGAWVVTRIVQTMFQTLTVRQLQAIAPLWVDSYKATQNKAKKPTDIEAIPYTKIQGMWFGDKHAAKTIMVWALGGGFACPGLDVHAQMFNRMGDWAGSNLAIFVPEYSLTPYAVYPQALGEMVEAIRFIMDGVGRNKEIIIGGDSAGGQLAIAILSHVSGHEHPQKTIVKPLDLQGRRFKGALLMSPWVSSDTEIFTTMRELSRTDSVSPAIAHYWNGVYRAGCASDHFIVPESAPAKWWANLGDSVEGILVLAGADETLRDAIKSWSDKAQEGWSGKVRLIIGKGESHDQCLQTIGPEKLKAEVSGKEETQEGAMYHWIKDLTA